MKKSPVGFSIVKHEKPPVEGFKPKAHAQRAAMRMQVATTKEPTRRPTYRKMRRICNFTFHISQFTIHNFTFHNSQFHNSQFHISHFIFHISHFTFHMSHFGYQQSASSVPTWCLPHQFLAMGFMRSQEKLAE